MACNWLMMTSFGDDMWPSENVGLLTDKKKKISLISGDLKVMPCECNMTVTSSQKACTLGQLKTNVLKPQAPFRKNNTMGSQLS